MAAGFIDYILGALLRHGCHYHLNLADALQRIIFRMLSRPARPSEKQDEPSSTSTKSRPFDLRLGNPLEADLQGLPANDIRNIMGGKIPALRTRQKTGALSIGYDGDTGDVSPDEIPARMPSGEEEMLNDILGC